MQIVWCGSFASFEEWCNKASSWLAVDPFTARRPRGPFAPRKKSHLVCEDTKGRRCGCGSEFMRARDEGAFPIRFGWPEKHLPERYRESGFTRQFEPDDARGDFSALYAAEEWLTANGYSFGSSCTDGPIAIVKGSGILVAKWRNLTAEERALVHGTLHFDRGGAAIVKLKLPPDQQPAFVPPAVTRASVECDPRRLRDQLLLEAHNRAFASSP